MAGSKITAPPGEQKICITCGFCCDGTLFMHAHLNAGERGNLPGEIEQASFSEEGKDYFRLPCHYFSEKCTIYGLKRADVCSSYRCQLLKDFAEGNISPDDAVEMVRKAKALRNVLLEDYRKAAGEGSDTSFREVLVALGKKWAIEAGDGTVSPVYDILQARCNILEALLVKYFRSAEDFEKLIMS